MIRALAVATLALSPAIAIAQTPDARALICLSVAAPDQSTEVAIFGADATALVVTVPPPAAADALQSRLVTLPPTAFPAMAATLRTGLADLPPPPAPDACAGDILGPVSLALATPGQATQRYDAPYLTQEVAALKDALIDATGDPPGDAPRAWTSPPLPVMHDICRTLP
ncbi:hypothetical protein [Gymnodinialimonas ulvae]|uniref:hypothetical protein n=1 Tax=Gymnodinialimonas ulvae TaxID=3126504 RepID=UPI00309E085F